MGQAGALGTIARCLGPTPEQNNSRSSISSFPSSLSRARIRDCCALMTRVLRDDDMDSLQPKAYEHAKQLAGEEGAAGILLRALESATAARDA